MTGKRPVRARPIPPAPAEEVAAAVAAETKKARGRESVRAAIAAIQSAAVLPFADALAAERAAFLRLKTGEEATALRHLFFAERAARKLDGDAAPLPVKRVGIVGGGTMGSGIAATFAANGFAVSLCDTSPGGARTRAGKRRRPPSPTWRAIGKATLLAAIRFVDGIDASRRCRPRRRSRLRGPGGQARGDRENRRPDVARDDPRIQHQLSRYRRAGRRERGAGALPRPAFLRSGASHAPPRDRPRQAGRRRRRWRPASRSRAASARSR